MTPPPPVSSCFLDLQEIQQPTTQVQRTFSATALGTHDEEQYRLAAPATLDAILKKDDTKYHLLGRIDATLQLQCARCLEPYPTDVSVELDLLYVAATENRGEPESQVEESDLSTAYFRDDRIDLGQLVREQFQLSLPMKPLCRDECRGLCVVCGGNRNVTVCECDETWEDPRFAGLKHLLKQ
ncbi:MAG: DUF177 domain-containing protein [Acidobacteriota bacterium]|nr:DUF177 domain-containing protein [Acidobacteriota bacterium]